MSRRSRETESQRNLLVFLCRTKNKITVIEKEWRGLSKDPSQTPPLSTPVPQTGRQLHLAGKEDQVEAETESADFTRIPKRVGHVVMHNSCLLIVARGVSNREGTQHIKAYKFGPPIRLTSRVHMRGESQGGAN